MYKTNVNSPLKRTIVISLWLIVMVQLQHSQPQPGVYWNGAPETAPTPAALDKIVKDHELWISSNGQKGARAELSHRMLANFDLEGVNLCGAQLDGAFLAGANLRKAIFGFSGVTGQQKENRTPGDPAAFLPAAPVMLTVTVDGQVVSQSIPGITNLNGASLREANLDSADLSYSNLSMADLSNADLRNADLRSADLTGANLAGATLDGSNFGAANLKEILFEPSSVSSVVGIENAENLEYATFAESPDALIKVRKRFEEEGLIKQAREITFAINRRKTQLDPKMERWFRIAAFDLTCKYGMDPGRPLRIIAACWMVFSVLYFIILHRGRCFRVRISRFQRGRDENREFWMWSSSSRMASQRGWFRRLWNRLKFEVRSLCAMMFFSLVNAFNLGYREFSIGQWLRMLTKRQYDVKATGWVRSLAGIQSVVSIYLFALWILTYFGRPFN